MIFPIGNAALCGILWHILWKLKYRENETSVTGEVFTHTLRV